MVYDEGDSQDARRLFSQLDNNAYHVLVPQIILGKIVAKILDKSDSNSLWNDLGNLCEIFFKHKINVEECLPNISRYVLRIMLDVQDLDERLTPNDVTILSEVLADPYSKFFFIRGRTMLESLKIKKYESGLFEGGSRNAPLKTGVSYKIRNASRSDSVFETRRSSPSSSMYLVISTRSSRSL